MRNTEEQCDQLGEPDALSLERPIKRSEVTAAIIAAIQARAALHNATLTRGANPPVVRLSGEVYQDTTAQPVMDAADGVNGAVTPPTSEALEAAQEAALATFSESVQVAARAALKARLGASNSHPASLTNTRQRSQRGAGSRLTARPSLVPQGFWSRRPTVVVPPYPSKGLDHPQVRAEWIKSHHDAADARYLLESPVLRAYAEAQLACERWDAQLRGRKPSGDLRHPVARDRLKQITKEMTGRHEKVVLRAEATISAIASGDVVGVETSRFSLDQDSEDIVVPVLVLQSELDRRAAVQHAKANRTPEQIEAESAEWDAMIEQMMAELPPEEPELEIPNLPELPVGREPTSAELWMYSNALSKHLRYLEKGEQIEAQRRRDAATKVRTAARLEAERADPEGTAAAKQAVKLAKAADRQRRWRERQKTAKGRRET